MKKIVRSALIVLVVLAPAAYFFPWWTLAFVLCGVYDVSRNRALDASKVAQYFTGNGILTWVLAPFNTLLDILCLPFINRGIYQLEQLPPGHQAEIQKLIDASRTHDLVGKLHERTKDQPRTMIFFKWYGQNVDTFVDIPEFHEKYKYIQTIGVSVFNVRESTSRHFGPFRATLRVLYNINQMKDKSAFIEVGDVTQYWIEKKLFIFDDTLMHQSFNQSDSPRYNLFVDIVRPSPLRPILVLVVHATRFFLKGVNSVFYKNWKVIKK
jgi:hypothetical protein